MLPLHPISTRTNTLFPYTTLFRSTARRHHVDPADTVCPTHRNLPAHLWPVQNQNTGNRCRQQEREKAHHRSEEHTYELQSLMRNSYAIVCLKQKHNPMNINIPQIISTTCINIQINKRTHTH